MRRIESSWRARVATLLIASSAMLSTGPVFAQGTPSCDAGDAIRKVGMQSGWMAALERTFAGGQCDSIIRVIGLLANRPRSGGRDLTPPKPLDRQGGASQLQRAKTDPEYLRLYAEASAGETDPIRLQVIQAATLDDMGHYKARDLVIDQLLQGR